MHLGVRYGTLDVLNLLAEHGAVIRGRNLVSHAAVFVEKDEARCLEVIRFLLDRGASIDAYYRDNYDESHMELCGGFPVVDYGFGKQNALHIAIGHGSVALVKLLLERGADTSLPGWSVFGPYRGKTMSPVEAAKGRGYEEIVELLERSETSGHAS